MQNQENLPDAFQVIEIGQPEIEQVDENTKNIVEYCALVRQAASAFDNFNHVICKDARLNTEVDYVAYLKAVLEALEVYNSAGNPSADRKAFLKLLRNVKQDITLWLMELDRFEDKEKVNDNHFLKMTLVMPHLGLMYRVESENWMRVINGEYRKPVQSAKEEDTTNALDCIEKRL